MAGTSVRGREIGKHKLLKVVLIGDAGVGKSSLMNRFVKNVFDAQSFHTIGVEFLNKQVTVRNKQVTLQVWDTAGQERFKSLRTPFYRGADICILTYAVDDENSFDNLSVWKNEFTMYSDIKDRADKFPFSVWGNKIDCPDRKVSQSEAHIWCKNHGNLPYYETSAKDSTNVDKAFHAAVEHYLDLEGPFDGNLYISNGKYTVDLTSPPNKTSSSFKGNNCSC